MSFNCPCYLYAGRFHPSRTHSILLLGRQMESVIDMTFAKIFCLLQGPSIRTHNFIVKLAEFTEDKGLKLQSLNTGVLQLSDVSLIVHT